MVDSIVIILLCLASFTAGIALGGLLIFLGLYLASRYSAGGRWFIPSEESAFQPHEVDEDYFERALNSPEHGGLQFPADFSDEALDELAQKMKDETGAKDETELRTNQLRGY